MSGVDPGLVARMDQHGAAGNHGVTELVKLATEGLELFGDDGPDAVAVTLANELETGMSKENLATLLGFAVVRIARAERGERR